MSISRFKEACRKWVKDYIAAHQEELFLDLREALYKERKLGDWRIVSAAVVSGHGVNWHLRSVLLTNTKTGHCTVRTGVFYAHHERNDVVTALAGLTEPEAVGRAKFPGLTDNQPYDHEADVQGDN